MEEQTKRRLLEKNQRLIDMVIDRAKRDFPKDIALIGLSGSFSTGDFHEKSDLDLVIINNTDRGWDISRCFILDEVGYDIYCTPWDTRIREEANLESPMVSCLVDMQVLYYATPEDLARFNTYRQKALELLAKPFGPEALERAEKSLGDAKRAYADVMLAEGEGGVRHAAGEMLLSIVNALTHLNSTYIHRGIKRYLEELLTYQNLPEDFERLYTAVILAKDREAVRTAAAALLRATQALYERLKAEFAPPPKSDKQNLWGTYEELWCNYRNKVLASVAAADPAYAYFTAIGAQDYLNEMTEVAGTPRFDLLQFFDPQNLEGFQREFLRIMDAYLEEYRRVGLTVDRFDSVEEVYARFMGPKKE